MSEIDVSRRVRRPPRARRLTTLLALLALPLAACRVVADEAPSGLEVTTSLRAPRVSIDDYPNGIALSVRATNTGSNRLVVRFDSAGAGSAAVSGFGLRVYAADGRKVIDTEVARPDSVAVFGAGQTRRQRFRIALGAHRPGGLATGDYTIVSRYGGRDAAPVRLTVIP